MPSSVVNTQVTLLPAAPTAADSPGSFPLIAHNFFGSIWTAVLQINVRTGAYTTPPTPLTEMPHPPADSDAAFVTLADAHLAAMPLLVTQANGMIDELLLPCAHITALPPIPSRGGNPTGFASAAATLLAALPTFRTEFNAFINAVNAYNPASPFGSNIAWRLQIDTNNGHGTVTGFSDLKFYDSTNTIIPTTGGTSFSGGSGTDQISGDVARLFDSNSGTSWNRSSATNTICGYIFSSAKAVAKIDIYTGTATSAAPLKGRLQYSSNTTTGLDGTWTTAFEIWEPSWPASGTATRTWPQAFPSGKYKGLRLRMSANNGDTFIVLNTVEFRATVGGADQSSGGISFATDVTGADAAAAVFDGNAASHYDISTSATPLPQSVGYYFATPVSVAQYLFLSNSNNGRIPRDFKLQGSTNGTWTDLNTQAGIGGTIPFTGTYTV